MARFKLVNGVEIQLTPEEELARDQEELDWANRPIPTLDEIDTEELNRLLLQEGSVLRALAEFVFRLSKGQIPIDPTRTSTQFKTILKTFMRT